MEMAQMIKDRKITSSKLVNDHIQFIKDINPDINAMVCNRFDEALAEAKKCDDIIAKTEDTSTLSPYFGVPCTVKESMKVVGMPFSAGLVSRKNIRSQVDSPIVSNVKKAGCIILGVTNTSEACMWLESSNYVYGRTNNPYDLKRTTGGSSGGEASIISSCGSPWGIGSDVGGSIRMPAFFAGIFGHKPSSGMVDNDGQYPVATNEMLSYVCTGPICRRSIDLWPLFEMFVGKSLSKNPNDVNVSKLRVMSIEGFDRFTFGVAQDLIDSQRSVCSYFESIGCMTSLPNISKLYYGFEIWSAMMSSAKSPTFIESMENPNVALELIKWTFNLSNHTFPALGLCALETITKFIDSITDQNKGYVKMGKELQDELNEMLGHDGVLLFPSHPICAPKHDEPKFVPFRFAYTGIFNVLELPVTQVPLGLNKEGLPLGIQVVAASGNDHLTIAVAQELEKKFGGWKSSLSGN